MKIAYKEYFVFKNNQLLWVDILSELLAIHMFKNK